MTYSTMAKALAALESKGFTYVRPSIMGAAPFRNGSAYAWIGEEWSRQHRAMRFRTHIAG